MSAPPSGTISFLFSDIEGSTRRLQAVGRDLYGKILREHQRLLHEVWQRHGGYEAGTEGDALFVAFAQASEAVAAAGEAQRALAQTRWPDGQELRVRIGIHSGEASLHEGGYVGMAVHRAARIAAAAHGGQVLVSEATRALCAGEALAGVALRDLGLHRLKDLTDPQRLYQLVGEGLEADFPPPKTLENRLTNLPSQPTPLIGRERELRELEELLGCDEVRLLTLTGPGGTGKTRLALLAGANQIELFEDGVYFVALAALVDPLLFLPTVAQTLSVRDSGAESLQEALAEHLREREMLLVLDNFEQLLDAAPAVAELLRNSLYLKVLVTSRAPLHLGGEREYAVPPLDLPRPDEISDVSALSRYESVALFVERAQAVKSDFVLTSENGAAVAEICARLDGLPLAIELAAARVRVLPPRSLLARLDERLKLLTSGPRDAPERQQTLRATLDWSYALLTEDEQRLFARFSVFLGGATLAAAEAVCDPEHQLTVDLLDALGSLVEKNLVRQREDASGEPRFSMLQTIREYACEHLEKTPEAVDIRRWHAQFFSGLARRSALSLRGREQQATMGTLASEQDNLRSSLAFLVERREFEAAQQMAADLALFWETRGQFQEEHEWFDQVLAEEEPSSSHGRASALFWAGRLALFCAEWQRAARLLGDSAELAGTVGDPLVQALAIGKRAWVLVETGNVDAGIGQSEAALALARKSGDSWTIAETLNDAALCNERTNPKRAIELIEESLALRRTLGDVLNIVDSLNNLGYVSANEGDSETAQQHLQEGLRLAREIGDFRHIVLIVGNLGNVGLFGGDYETAAEHYRECLRVSRRIGDRRIPLEAMRGLAAIATVNGDIERAAVLSAAATSLHREFGGTLSSAEIAMEERFFDPARARVGSAIWDCAAEGAAEMSLDAAVALALTDSRVSLPATNR